MDLQLAERIAFFFSTSRVRECVRSLRGITGNRWQDGEADWKFTDGQAHRTQPYPMGFYADDTRLYWAIGWGMSEHMLPWERWLVRRAALSILDNERIATRSDEVRDAVISAYQQGALDVHEAWIEGCGEENAPSRDPDFTEAAHDYAANLALATPSNEALLREALRKIRVELDAEYAYAKKREDEEAAIGSSCRYFEGIAEGTCDTMNRVTPIIDAALNPPGVE